MAMFFMYPEIVQNYYSSDFACFCVKVARHNSLCTVQLRRAVENVVGAKRQVDGLRQHLSAYLSLLHS